MKIVHLMGYYVPELGYQEYYIAKKHKDFGHEVYVIASELLYPFPNIESMLKEAGIKNTSRFRDAGFKKMQGINVYRLNHFFEYSDFILAKGLKTLLKEIKPDIVFAHESRQGLPAMAAFYKKSLKYKLVVDQHDFYHSIPNYPIHKKILRFFDYYLFRKFLVNYSMKNADRIIAVTEETKNFLVKTHKISLDKISLIPLGVDTDFFKFRKTQRKKIRKAFKIKDNDVVLVFSGTIVRRKGLEILINALSEISTKNLKLIIIGGGEESYITELKNSIKSSKLENRVFFVGFLKKEKIKNYYSAADIGIWPGNNSISIIEAMACGLPIIMADMQLAYLVGYHNGIKFPRGNISKLKEAIIKIASNKKARIIMGKNSLEAVKKNYSYEIIAKQFLEK